MIDWGTGEYERTATQIEPAAAVAVGVLEPQPGERIVDIGCGTGNATLLAARAGASVVGVDPADRLLDVARGRAAREGIGVEFTAGEAAALPFEAASCDAAMSVFGVIFAEPAEAAAELLRVVRPGGRIVVTTWVPSGAVHDLGVAAREVMGAPVEPPRWSDPEVVTGLFAPHRVRFTAHAISFAAASPQDYIDDFNAHHPLAVSMAEPLRAIGRADALNARALAILEAANEDPGAFRVTSRYWVVEITVS